MKRRNSRARRPEPRVEIDPSFTIPPPETWPPELREAIVNLLAEAIVLALRREDEARADSADAPEGKPDGKA